MKQIWKKRAVAAAVLVFVGAAVYLNWRYSDNVQKQSKVLGESTLVNSQQEDAAVETSNDYFATARLSRKQARDSAISMLQEAESDENAEQSVLNEASQTLLYGGGGTDRKSCHGQGLCRLCDLYGRGQRQRSGGGRGWAGCCGRGKDQGYRHQ